MFAYEWHHPISIPYRQILFQPDNLENLSILNRIPEVFISMAKVDILATSFRLLYFVFLYFLPINFFIYIIFFFFLFIFFVVSAASIHSFMFFQFSRLTSSKCNYFWIYRQFGVYVRHINASFRKLSIFCLLERI